MKITQCLFFRTTKGRQWCTEDPSLMFVLKDNFFLLALSGGV